MMSSNVPVNDASCGNMSSQADIVSTGSETAVVWADSCSAGLGIYFTVMPTCE